MNDASAIGRNGYSHNPKLAEAAFESVRKDSNFLDVADKALKSVLTVKASENNGMAKVSERDMAKPNLTEPVPKAHGELNSAGKLALLLGQLMDLLGDVSISQMEGRLATWTAMMNAQKAMGEQLSLELQTAQEELEQATDAYQSALSSLKTSKAALDAANKKLIQAQAKLDGLSPEDAGYTQALAARDQAANENMLVKQRAEQAEKTALEVHSLVKTKAESVDKLLTQAQGLGVKNEMIQKGAQDNLSSVAKLTLLMAMFVELIGKNSEESLQNDLELFQALQDGRQKELDKKSSEYQDEVRKSEELNRIMGCFGKIAGALLIVISVVAAVFSGGAALVLAGIGLALMFLDMGIQAATGVSFTQEALKPLMENVLKPLMDLIGKGISKALEDLGVDKKTADMVGAIAGAILAVVALVVLIVAVAIVGKGAAAKLAPAFNKFMGDAINKLVPSMLKEFAKNTGKMFSQGAQRLSDVLGKAGSKVGLNTSTDTGKQLMANRLNTGVLFGEVAYVSTEAAGNVSQGVFMKNASDALADFWLAHTAMEQIQQWLKQAVEHFSDNQKITAELQKNMSAALQQNAEASRFALRSSRA